MTRVVAREVHHQGSVAAAIQSVAAEIGSVTRAANEAAPAKPGAGESDRPAAGEDRS